MLWAKGFFSCHSVHADGDRSAGCWHTKKARIERTPSFLSPGQMCAAAFFLAAALGRALTFQAREMLLPLRSSPSSHFPPLLRPLYLEVGTEVCLILGCLRWGCVCSPGGTSAPRAGVYKPTQPLSPSKSCPSPNVVLDYLRHVASFGKVHYVCLLDYNTTQDFSITSC